MHTTEPVEVGHGGRLRAGRSRNKIERGKRGVEPRDFRDNDTEVGKVNGGSGQSDLGGQGRIYGGDRSLCHRLHAAIGPIHRAGRRRGV